jgi:DNA-binding GntR family transcriptional regulator
MPEQFLIKDSELSLSTAGLADALEQERLSLAPGDRVIRLQRSHSRGRPAASHQIAVLPLDRFPGLTPGGDVLDDIVALARAHGLVLGRATETFDWVTVPSDVADHLGIDPDEIVSKVDRVVRCAHGRPIEWRVIFSIP